MNKNLLKAKGLLLQNGLTFVALNKNNVISSKKRGVAPLLDLIDRGVSLTDYFIADKVVGKAAAFLYVRLGVKHVYIFTASTHAINVLEKYNITYECENIVPAIRNRTDTGYCPMETAVLDSSEPNDALIKIKSKLQDMKKSGNPAP